jgi:radical SAM protein with 4Fe4S-binding SPASM domain
LSENIQFIIKTFRMRRCWNALKSYSSFYLSQFFKKPIVWGLPPVIMVEPTNVCNLKCPLCPTGAGTLKRKHAWLNYDNYKKLIDEIAPDTFMVLLWNQGESFMHEEFLKMVSYASDADLWTYGSTNGHYLDNPEDVVRSGLGTLLVSVDGASAETYEAYRRSGNFEQVIDGLKSLTAAKKKLHSKTPVIHLQFIVMRHNEHELEEINRVARECGVDRLTLKTVQIYDDADIDVWLPDNLDQSRYKVDLDESGEKHFAMKHGYPNSCKRLWNQPVLNAGGEISVCCFDKDSDFAMGNMHESSFREIWHSVDYMKFRQAIFDNRGQFEMCRNCGEGVKLNLDQQDIDVDLKKPLKQSLTKAAKNKSNSEIQTRIKEATTSRKRQKGGLDKRLEQRSGVAGMSMGSGPKEQKSTQDQEN